MIPFQESQFNMKQILCGLTLLVIIPILSCRGTIESSAPAGARGGRLVTAQIAGPKTFNPLFADDSDTITVSNCMQAPLVRINRKTQQTEPELAESAQFSPDGRVFTVRLRPNLQFSDGHPLTADDVVFTFQVIYDPHIPSGVADTLKVGGDKIRVESVDDRTLHFTFPEPYAGAERLFDSVPVLPKHVLEPIYREGKFQEAWGLATPPSQLVTAGPFSLQAYEPGRRTALVRNPHYWKRDAQGNALPYLDGIDFLIVADKSTQLLKFQQGELDALRPLLAQDVQTLQPLVQRGEAVTADLGPSLIAELLWFNLNPGHQPHTDKPYVDPVELKWFSQVKFRQAIALAIDRAAIVDAVFSGKATPLPGFVSPGETQWYDPQLKPYPYDPNQAGELLNQLGLIDRDGNGVREDDQGHPVQFRLVTNAGNAIREKMGLMIQEDLKNIGIEVHFAPVESKILLGKLSSQFDYEACLFSLNGGDTDPNAKSSFLLSSGNLHWWYPEQKTPATPWEAEIDQLMAQQAKTMNPAQRKKIFDRVQQIMTEQVPAIPLVARNLLIAARHRVGNLKPGIIHDSVLWNAEELYLR
jgi:peptide/nickel transport system substrate-binding protein